MAADDRLPVAFCEQNASEITARGGACCHPHTHLGGLLRPARWERGQCSCCDVNPRPRARRHSRQLPTPLPRPPLPPVPPPSNPSASSCARSCRRAACTPCRCAITRPTCCGCPRARSARTSTAWSSKRSACSTKITPCSATRWPSRTARLALFLPVRAPTGKLVGIAMILADSKSIGDDTLERMAAGPGARHHAAPRGAAEAR